MIDDVRATLGRFGARFDLLAAAAKGDAHKLAGLALAAKECGRGDLVYPLARDARALAPRDPEVLALTQGVIASGVQQWHMPMLEDAERHDRYRRAIERLVRPGDRVLDIGAGTGLLAMIAARAGAAHVWSCEERPAIADVAREIVALNGFADRVTIVTALSSDIDPSAFGGPVDVVISEVIAGNLIGEGMLPTIEDAAARLLAPGGRMLPLAGDVVVALAHLPSLDDRARDVCGFDLSPVERLMAYPRNIDIGRADLALRSAPVDLYRFDFTRGGDWGDPRASARLVTDGGRANGVVMWMRLKIDEAETYESRPGPGNRSSWTASFYRWDRPRDLAPGAVVAVEARRRGNNIQLWVPGEASGEPTAPAR